MASASDYKISFPYGATSAPYSPTRPHRGDDRACPSGTPVICEGVNIGLVGSTGMSTGPHLHIQEWQGSPANTRKPQNSFKGGTVTASTFSSDFGNYVTINLNGWNTTYAHLSKINVTKGQVIQGGTMFQTIEEVKEAYLMLRGKAGTDAEMRPWIGLPKQRFFQVGKAEADSTRKQLADVKKALANEQAKPPKEVIKVVEKIIEKPVEKIVVAPVDEKQVVTNVLKRFWESLFKK